MRKKSVFSWKRILAGSVSGIVFVELACLAGGYFIYRRINHDPDFRYVLYKSRFSGVLEGYYKLGEKINPALGIREADLVYWKTTGREV